jgi:hypothetical protein
VKKSNPGRISKNREKPRCNFEGNSRPNCTPLYPKIKKKNTISRSN